MRPKFEFATVAGQPAVTYAYDDANRLLSITQNSKTITYTYDNANRLTQAKLGNGVTKNFVYDVASQLTSITFKKPDNSVLGDLLYAYDKVGQIVSLTGSLASVTLPPATTAIAAYDANNHLTNWNGQAITYDNQGNMTSASGRTHTWDTRNRLTAITGSAVASFQYDALGRRISKTTPSTGNTATALTYDGSNPVVEKQGTTVTGTNLTSLGIDSYLTRGDTQAGVTKETYPLTDHLGSVIALTDATGSIVTSYGYEPYGNTTSSGAASKNPHQYTGRENDGTGLYYYRARYYDPKLMRFVSEDPIGLAGGLNSYAYVGGNPMRFTDPRGLNPIAGAIGGAEIGTLIFPGVGTVIGGVVGFGAGLYIAWQISNYDGNANAVHSSYAPGVWPANTGAEEWGRRNGIGGNEGRRRFHKIKQGCKGQPKDDFGVNPDTGEVYDPEGQQVGNLDEVKSK